MIRWNEEGLRVYGDNDTNFVFKLFLWQFLKSLLILGRFSEDFYDHLDAQL